MWNEVLGQEETKQRLVSMAQSGRIPHALLLCGPEGCGKMAMAMSFASYILCPHHGTDGEPCHQCVQCAMLKKWEHPDLIFSYPTIKQKSWPSERQPVSDDYSREWHDMLRHGLYFTLTEWTERMKVTTQQAIITGAESDELSHKLSLVSSQGGYKVCIIWLPEKMNATSANKLLKLLEEPPSQTVFIMVSEEPDVLLDTIISRTQRIDMKALRQSDIEEALIQRRGIAAEQAQRIAHVAYGSWQKALEELQSGNENQQFLDFFIQLMRHAYMRDVRTLRDWSETVSAFGREKQKRMLNYYLRLMRENFMYNFRRPELVYMTQSEENFSKNFARFINERNILPLSDKLQEALRGIGQNANAKVVFFDLALSVIMHLKH